MAPLVVWSVQYANSSRKKDLQWVFIIFSTDIDHQHNICEDHDINGARLQYCCMESKIMVMLGEIREIIHLFDRWERHFQSQIWSHMKQVWQNECNPTLPSSLLMCHFKPNLWKKKKKRKRPSYGNCAILLLLAIHCFNQCHCPASSSLTPSCLCPSAPTRWCLSPVGGN